jgi:hypothetical protein
LISFDDKELFFLDLLSIHKELVDLVRLEFLQASNNSNLKLGCLKLMRSLNKDMIQLLVTDDIIQRLNAIEEKLENQKDDSLINTVDMNK